MFIFPKDEIKRKSFHLLSFIYIAAYVLLPTPLVLWCMGALLILVIAGEILRLKVSSFNTWILNNLGGTHRAEETNRVSGLPWTLSGSLLTMLIFNDKKIVTAALLYLALGDASAALFGKKYGKHKILGQKTIEGTLACFLVCFLIGLFFFNLPLAAAGALVVSVIELTPWPLNDNFWIPLVSSSVIYLILPIF